VRLPVDPLIARPIVGAIETRSALVGKVFPGKVFPRKRSSP